MLREENAQLKHSVTIPKTKNEFAIFSPLSKFWRNSDYIDTQYEDIDFWGNETIKSKKAVDGFDDELTEDDEYNRENGLLFSKHLNSKFTNQFSDFYQIMQSEEIFCINMILDEKDEPSGLKNEKFFDYPIHVKNTKSGFETTFTVHKRFFFNRLGIQPEQFSLDRKNLTFQFGENEGSIVGDLDIRSVAIFIHILYSDQETHTLTPMINFDQSICSGIERLSYTFSKVPFDEAMSRTFGDETCGDITVRLANDQQVKAWKYLLISRSEYFKQLFSNAWLDAKDVDFRHVEKSTWKLLMNYFQGLANDEIFYETIKGLIESNIKKINLNSVLLKRKPKAVLTENQDRFGFLPRGTFTNDLSPKIMMLREENAQLKHSVTIPKTKNEFAIFSPLSKFWRNSDYIDTQYEDIDFWGNEMIKSKKAVDGFDDELTEDDEYNRENGLLFSKHLNSKFTNRFSDFYQIMQSEEIFCINMILDEKDELSGLKNEKFFDYPIHVKNTKSGFETTFTVHKRFFFNRLGIQSEQFSLDRKNLTFQFGENEGSIVGDLDIRSVAIFIHILYSDQETHTLTPMINFDQSICSGIERLSYTFSKVPFDEAMSRTFGDETCGDITVRLANDQQVKAWKYLLISRSEYFKQLFSNAWLDAKDVDFRHVEKSTWKLLMNYFQGLANDEIFYETIKGLIESNIKKINLNSVLLKRKPKAVLTENQDSYIENDDFVNLVLDLMYLSNELLLPDLKNLCELAIKDCITLDNYDVLLLHSYYSKSEQLFSNCSWFIFRNLLSSYNDPKTNYTALGDECCELLEQRLHELIEIYYTGGRQGLLGSRGIKNFKDDIESFNGHFLHEYLWDVYGVTDDDIFKHDALQRNKSGTVKQVRSSSVSSNIGDSRRHETDSPVQPRLDLGSAIDTKDENDAGSGFIVVEKGRRKSSTSKPKTSSPVPTRRSSKGGFRLSEDVKTFLSKENETAIGEDKPVIKEWTFRISNEGSSGDVLVGSSHDIDEILQQRTHKRTTLKSTKMTIPKLSQKERKQKEREEAEKQRLALENDRSKAKGTAVNSSPWNINNAWGVSTSKVVGTPVDDSLGPKSISKFTELNTAAVITPNKLTAVHFPTLEELRHAKKTTEFIPSAVLEELDEPVVPIKTLDEIRQEEEFARWWEEESRREAEEAEETEEVRHIEEAEEIEEVKEAEEIEEVKKAAVLLTAVETEVGIIVVEEMKAVKAKVIRKKDVGRRV
ncbi:hypothetical protein JL09_g2998 [Pichia kudriavzevii]|uniref:BTB domain-containing protein n=1 Tax=Pichia kudriavzevii TaxID=4909 RepID=A0A099P1F2_PICKU|nr:hypothetical protein JL09_g2998 [Pichia kudriavzevii]